MTSNGVKTAQEIYEQYRIMPSLQLHQLRVAAVGKTLCDNFTREIDGQSVVLACLFHDMGNIIKSDWAFFPEFVEPEGVAHWQMVKDDFLAKYGEDSHSANVAIAKEIGLPADACALIDGIGYSKLERIRDGHSFELKIAEYGDMRTGPHGVISMLARIEEGKLRYESKHPKVQRSESEWESILAAAREIEQQVFAEADIAPEDITEQSIHELIPELRAYAVV